MKRSTLLRHPRRGQIGRGGLGLILRHQRQATLAPSQPDQFVKVSLILTLVTVRFELLFQAVRGGYYFGPPLALEVQIDC